MEILTALFIAIQIFTLSLVLQLRKKASDPDQFKNQESKARTQGIIHKAIQQANKILVSAELKGLQIVSKQKMTGGEMGDKFTEHLNTIEKALEEQLEHNAAHAEEEYATFIQSAEQSIKDHIQQNQMMLAGKSDMLIQRTESLLTKFTADLEQKVKTDVDKQLAQAAEEVVQYEQHRMRVIDERIVDILEDVVRIILEKKMSLADQSELIYKALEEAKRTHAFTTKLHE